MNNNKFFVSSDFVLAESPEQLNLSFFNEDDSVSSEVLESFDDLLSILLKNTREQVVAVFDNLESRVNALNIDEEGLSGENVSQFRERLMKILKLSRADVLESSLTWENKGELLFISLLINQKILDSVNRFEGILNVVERISVIKAESRQTLENLEEIIRTNEDIISSFFGLKKLSPIERKKLSQAENTAKNRVERKVSRKKKHDLLLKDNADFINLDSQNVEELWTSAEKIVESLYNDGWISNIYEKDELLTLRNIKSVFDLVVQLVEKDEPLVDGIDFIDDEGGENAPDVLINRRFWVLVLALLMILSGGFYLKKVYLNNSEDLVVLQEADFSSVVLRTTDIPDNVDLESFKKMLIRDLKEMVSIFLSKNTKEGFWTELVYNGESEAFTLNVDYLDDEVVCTAHISDYAEMLILKRKVLLEKLDGSSEVMWQTKVKRICNLHVKMSGPIEDDFVFPIAGEASYFESLE